MRARLIVSAMVLVGLSGVGTYATTGHGVGPNRQWAVVNLVNPVQVSGNLLMGPYLIVHDDAKMARGEPCTTFYRFTPGKGPTEAAVSFHCKPAARPVATQTTLTITTRPDTGMCKLTEYQFPGEAEGHEVPDAR